jgi:hypothetical protein
MDLKQTFEKTERFEGEWNGEKFSFNAFAYALTPEFRQEWVDSLNQPSKQSNVIARLIESWDITLDKKPFPPTAENLGKCPEKFLTYIFDMVLESYAGNEETPQKSQSSSAA